MLAQLEMGAARRRLNENEGVIEIRWNGDDPDDVVAGPVRVHVERMNDGVVWFCIIDPVNSFELHMNFYADKKDVLRWTVQEWRD